jgi:hypothetical protein
MKYALMNPLTIQHILKQSWKPGQFEFIPIIVTSNMMSTINIDQLNHLGRGHSALYVTSI